MRTTDDILAHFGVKGMRWGVRRDASSGIPNTPAARKMMKEIQDHNAGWDLNTGKVRSFRKSSRQVSSDHKNARMLQRKGVSALNNQQLKTVNERLNLEQNFNRMNPSTRKKGEMHIKELKASFALLAPTFIALSQTKGGQAAIKRGMGFVRGIATKLNNKEAVALKVLSDRIVSG